MKFEGGATIIPLRDGLEGIEFDTRTDAVSIFLEKAILNKANGWLTKDKEVAITAKLNIKSQKRSRTSSTLTISRVYKFDVSLYNDGRMEIPLKSLPLLDSFNLSGEDYIVTSVVANLYLSKRKEETGFSKTLKTLIKVSKKIPVPGNPYMEYASVFGDAFSEVIDDVIEESADTIPFATFGLRFLQGEKAIDFTEKPGVHAIIIGQTAKTDGIVNIENMDREKLMYDNVTGLKYNNVKVLNNHIIVRVVASTDPWNDKLDVTEVIKRLEQEVPAALNFSKLNRLKTPNLEAFVAKKIENRQ